jgi:hypothetical protein
MRVVVTSLTRYRGTFNGTLRRFFDRVDVCKSLPSPNPTRSKSLRRPIETRRVELLGYLRLKRQLLSLLV